MTDDSQKHGNDDLIIRRQFEASPNRVFAAWTTKDALAGWWGPKGTKLDILAFDLRLGGLFHYRLVLPNGQAMWGRFVFGDIRAPERLVFVSSFSNETADVVRAPFSPDWPLEVENVLTLRPSGDGTEQTLRGCPIRASDAERAMFQSAKPSVEAGFAGTFDALEAYLKET